MRWRNEPTRPPSCGFPFQRNSIAILPEPKGVFMLIRIAPLFTVLFLVAPVVAQEKENPIEKEVKASLTDLKKPFVMLVTLKIKDGTAEKFEAAFAKARTETRK